MQSQTSVPSIPLPTGRGGDWSVWGAIAFAIVVVGAAQLGGLIALALWTGGRMTSLVQMGRLPSGEALAAARSFVIAQLAIQGFQIALALWFAGRGGRDRWRAVDLVPVRLSAGRWIGFIVLFFVVKAVAATLAAYMSGMSTGQEVVPFRVLLREPATQWMFLATVVLAAVGEELVFRGVLSRTFEATPLGFWLGAAFVNAAFALVHLQYGTGGQFVVFVIGLTLSWMRMRTGSLWPCIVVHAVNNAVAIAAVAYQAAS